MRNLVLALVLVSTLNVLGQSDSDRQVVLNSLNNSRMDSILNFVTPTYANHKKYVSRMLDVLYAKDFNIILEMVKTKGFPHWHCSGVGPVLASPQHCITWR